MIFPPILKTLVSAPEPGLRRLIAWDHDTPADELVLLANGADLGVRLAVARRGLNSVRRLHHPYWRHIRPGSTNDRLTP